MTIPERTWVNYINRLRKVNDAAAARMETYLRTHTVETYAQRQALIEYAYAVATRYGEGAAELACEMYDALGLASEAILPAAEPAGTATIAEVAKTVNGTMKVSKDIEVIAAAVGRLVKMAGVDTTMENAIRDRAEWAWIPHGDTCAFCIALASRGWQKASREAMNGGHAEHIHANCDCTYAVRFNNDTRFTGYEPDEYYDMYMDGTDAPYMNENNSHRRDYLNRAGVSRRSLSEIRVNGMRREFYAENKEKINAQKRSAYAKRKELESSAAEETDVN